MAMTDKMVVNGAKRARTHLHDAEGYNPTGPHYKAVDRFLAKLIVEFSPDKTKVPNLGPIIKGGKSVLLHDCTHLTSGLDWPAFDDAPTFTAKDAGHPVLAPEAGYVDDNTSGAAGGDAFYFTGNSGIRYWVGHINKVPAQGTRFAKGAVMTTISGDHARPHVHLALDARKLNGGKHLKSHTNYTHGAPLIGAQLALQVV